MKRLEYISPTQPNIRNMMAADFYNLKIGLKECWVRKGNHGLFWFLQLEPHNELIFAFMLCV